MKFHTIFGKSRPWDSKKSIEQSGYGDGNFAVTYFDYEDDQQCVQWN